MHNDAQMLKESQAQVHETRQSIKGRQQTYHKVGDDVNTFNLCFASLREERSNHKIMRLHLHDQSTRGVFKFGRQIAISLCKQDEIYEELS